MSSRQSQTVMILEVLRAGRRISAIEALEEFGCFRLAARVHDLCQAGHDVRVEMVIDGGKRYAVYHLASPGAGQLQLADFGKPYATY
ncbi:MAG: hypothetical protein IID41_00455 [Planctomycetes bacterium]|nr:hypothetical protein [Planctomycetota bacterium]